MKSCAAFWANTNRKISGSVDFAKKHHQALALPNDEWPYWRDSIVEKRVYIESIGKAEKSEYFYLPIRFFWLGLGQLWAVKWAFISAIGREEFERHFITGRLYFVNDEEVEGWCYILPKPAIRLRDREITVPDGYKMASSSYYPLILDDEIHSRVRHFSQPELKVIFDTRDGL